MRELTFKGYLANYVRALSRSDTLNLKDLTEEAAGENRRLQAPLLLYAVKTGKEKCLIRYLQASVGGREMLDALSMLEGKDLETCLREKTLPEEYTRIWDSYQVRHNAPKRDEALK